MIKTYLLILMAVLFRGIHAKAQSFTLTKSAYEHAVGDVVTLQHYDTVSSLPRNTGQSQTWDFSAIIQSTNAISTTSYIAPWAVPSSSLFPGATMVGDNGYNYYTFYKSSYTPTTQLEYLGYDDISAVCHYTNSDIDPVWPIAYGYSNADSFSGTLTGASTGTSSGVTSISATGTGTLIFPGGIYFTNVMQIKTTVTEVQSMATPSPAFSFTNMSTVYDYYVPGQRSPIITLTDLSVIDSGDTSSYSSVSSSTTTSQSVLTNLKKYNRALSFLLFPNPAKQSLSIALENAGNTTCSIQIYNAVGEVVKELSLGDVADITATIDTSDLAPGIYFVKIEAGNASVVKKVVVE